MHLIIKKKKSILTISTKRISLQLSDIVVEGKKKGHGHRVVN